MYLHNFFFFRVKESPFINEIANFSSTGSNSPQNDSTSLSSDSSSSNIYNAPPPNPEPIPLPSLIPFPIFPFPPQVFLPQVQPWEGNEEEEREDFEELQLKAEEDAEDEAYNAFMGAVLKGRRRCRAFQAGFDSSTSASNESDSDSEESDSSNDSKSRDDEGKDEEEEDEEEEEEDMAPHYP